MTPKPTPFSVERFLSGDILIFSRTLEDRKQVLARLLQLLPPDKREVYSDTLRGMNDPLEFERWPSLCFNRGEIAGFRGDRLPTLLAQDFLALSTWKAE